MNVRDWAMVAKENRMDTNRPMQHLSHKNSSRVAKARATMAKHGARKPHTFFGKVENDGIMYARVRIGIYADFMIK